MNDSVHLRWNSTRARDQPRILHDTLTRPPLPATHLRNCPRRQHPTERSVGHALIVQLRSKACLVRNLRHEVDRICEFECLKMKK